jgi:hypothetical protein
MAFPPETEAQIGAKPRGSLQGISGALAEDIAISMIPGLGDGLFDSEGNRHTSTYVKTYKNIDGKWQETPFTINDINSNDFVFLIGSKTGGENRERVARNYRLQDGKFTPVGNPSYYKGAQDIGFFEGFVREGLPFVVSFIPGLNVAIGTALGATSAVAAQALGNAVIQASLSVAAGAKPGDALKNAAASFGVSQLVPNLTGNAFIDNALKSGATAALTNGDIGNAITNSLIATGAQAALSNTSITGDPRIDSGLVSGATSVAQAVATGGDPGQSFVRGFISGSTAKISQQEAAAERAASGAGFLGDYDDLSGAGPADYVMGERDPALVQAGFFDTTKGLVQSSLAELGRSWLAAGQQVGIAPEALQRGIDWLAVIQDQGEAQISPAIREQQDQFVRQIYSVASRPGATATEIGEAIIQATTNYPLGAFTLVSKELIQELPQLLIPGKAVAMAGNFALNIAESAGNQALEKIDELRRANPGMSNQQLIEAARGDAGISGLVTAVASLLPGASSKGLQPIVEGLKESLEEGITKYILTGDRNAATGSAVLGGVIGGKTTGAIQTGEQVADAAQRTFTEVPSLGTITVSSTRLPSDQPTVTPGEPLAITPSVVAKTEGGTNIPAPQVSSAVVIRTDPASNTALVIDSTGTTKIVSATDAATGQPVTQGQTLTITPDNTLTSGGGQVVPTGATPTGGMSALGMQNLQASSQYGQGAQQTLGQTNQQVQQPAGGQLTGVTPATAGGTQFTAPAQGGGTRPTTDTTVRPGQSEADLQQQARLAAEQDIANRTYKGQVYRTAEEAFQARLADTAPTTKPATAYSANVAATPEIVAELLALKGLPASEGTIRILMTGNPTIAQVGQEIEILTQMRRDQQPTVAPTQQPTGTPTVVTGQQTGPTIITDAAQQTKPVTTSTVTPTTTTGVTPTTTETINLTFDPGRVNIDTLEDTVAAVDTVGAVDTVRAVDTTPTFDTVEDTLPQDTVPTYGEDEDIIRFLGLDQEPTPTEPETTPAEDTIGGGVGGGTVDIPQDEQLAVAPKAVYTPKPGTRVVDTGTSILPTRVQLSEGMGDDVEGTGEEEQQPVWNVRSLKLRRALGI